MPAKVVKQCRWSEHKMFPTCVACMTYDLQSLQSFTSAVEGATFTSASCLASSSQTDWSVSSGKDERKSFLLGSRAPVHERISVTLQGNIRWINQSEHSSETVSQTHESSSAGSCAWPQIRYCWLKAALAFWSSVAFQSDEDVWLSHVKSSIFTVGSLGLSMEKKRLEYSQYSLQVTDGSRSLIAWLGVFVPSSCCESNKSAVFLKRIGKILNWTLCFKFANNNFLI